MYKNVLISKELWDRIKTELDGARLCDHDNILPLCDEIEAAEYGAKVREDMIARVVLDLSNITK